MDQELKHKNEDRIEVEVKKEIEYKLQMRMQRKRGLTIFAYNVKTGDISRVEIEKKVAVDFTNTNKVKKTNKAQHNPDCIYVQALNLKNAKKKIKKLVEKAQVLNNEKSK